MATNCGGIAAGVDIDCDHLPRGGTRNNLLLIKKDEWDLAVNAGTITFDGTTPNIIDACVLSTGDQGYLFEQFDDAVKPVVTGVKKASGYRYKQTLDFIVVAKTAAAEKVVNDMGSERYVAIYQNKYAGNDGDQKYKVFGVECGLRRPDGGAELDPYNDVDGCWMLKLESEDDALETKGQYTFYDSDEATTDAAFVVLQSAAE